MMEGDALSIGGRAWRVIMGYGHAPEHASLYCDAARRADLRRHAAAADLDQHQREPGRSADADPLRLFLGSQRRLIEPHCRRDTLVLPSHGLPFRGMRERVAQLEEHHRLRLGELEDVCGEPKCAADVLGTLFRRAARRRTRLSSRWARRSPTCNYLMHDGAAAARAGRRRHRAVRPKLESTEGVESDGHKDTQPEGADPVGRGARSSARSPQRSSNVLADFVNRHANGKGLAFTDELGIARAFMDMWAKLLADPMALGRAQMNMYFDYLRLWQSSWLKLLGQTAEPVAAPREGDNRFKDEDWQDELPLRLHQAVLPHRRAPHPRRRVGRRGPARTSRRGRSTSSPASTSTRSSPSNFALTNPQVLRETVEFGRHQPGQGPEEPARGPRRRRRAAAHQDDRREGLQARHNVATTPGKVVFQNDLMQLIQYEPATDDRLPAAAADHPALDQQVLHPRSAREELVHQVGGRAGPHGVRRVVGEPRRAPRRQGLRGLHARGHARRAGCDRAGDRRAQRQRDRLLPRRHAARRDARLHGGESATTA